MTAFNATVIDGLVEKVEAIVKGKIVVTFCGEFRVEQGIVSR